MKNLDKNIQELLYHYDCVIIPQFGGFVTNYKPANLDRQRDIISPPSKDISFNKNLLKNDGLLATSISRNSNVSFEKANAIIKETVESYFTTLNNGNRITFEKVGILYFDKNKNLQFNPDHSTNYLMDSYGFEPIYSPTVKQELITREPLRDNIKPLRVEKDSTPLVASAPPTNDDIEEDNTAKITQEKRQRPVRKLYWAAAAIALPLIAYTSFVSINTNFKNPAELTIADMNPFNRKAAALYSPMERAVSVFPESYTSPDLPESGILKYDLINATSAEDGVIVNFNKIENPKTASDNVFNKSSDSSSGPYHIIAGCFGSEANAKKLIKQYAQSSYKPAILDYHKGLYRVKLKSFSNFNQGLKELDQIKSGAVPSAWMLKKVK